MEVRAFYTVDGRPVEGSSQVPFTDLSYSLRWNEDGSIGLSIKWHRLFAMWRARQKLVPWKHSLAVIDNSVVRFAGPITSRRWQGMQLKVDGADGWGLWRKRLALNHQLASSWVDGEVIVDEDNPSPQWLLSFAGQTLAGIGALLVRESLKWGSFLVDVPQGETGTNVRNWPCWNGATVHDRLMSLTEVRNGPLIRWEPYLREDGHLRIRYRTGVAQRVHRWIQPAPEQRIDLRSVDEDGQAMATDAYAFGGRDEDVLLVARQRSTVLTDDGWPVLQVADTSHSTVSELDTLRGYAGALVDDGAMLPETYELTAPASIVVEPGDYIEYTMQDPYLAEGEGRTVPLVVVEVSRTTSDRQIVRAFPRER